jgi:hypothetical protein
MKEDWSKTIQLSSFVSLSFLRDLRASVLILIFLVEYRMMLYAFPSGAWERVFFGKLVGLRFA